jgi:hypothetical protein
VNEPEPIQKDKEDVFANEMMVINSTGYFDGFVNVKKEKKQ